MMLDRVFVALTHRTTKASTAVAMASLKLGVDINGVNAEGDTMLHVACRMGLTELVDMLIERGAVYPLDRMGPPHIAPTCPERAPPTQHIALAQRTRFEDVDGWDHTLTSACFSGRASQSLEIASANGSTPIHSAVSTEQESCVQQLLAARANVDARSRYGATPLLLAATRGQLGLVRMLLEAGADPHARDEMGMTASMHAKAYSHRAIMATLKSAERRHKKESNAPEAP